MDLLHKELTDKILKTFYEVYNELQYGFTERVYENSMYFELTQLGLKLEKQHPIVVFYKQIIVGQYVCDLVVEDKVIVEFKAQPAIVEAHEAQILNYLRATTMEVGLVLNFGSKPEFKRKVFANSRKKLPF